MPKSLPIGRTGLIASVLSGLALLIVVVLAIKVDDATIQRVNAAFSGVLMVITLMYALFTYFILRANQNMVEEQRRSSAEQTRPFVVVSLPSVDDHVHLVIANVGSRPATNISIEFSPSFDVVGPRIKPFAESDRYLNPALLQQPFLPPSTELRSAVADPKLVITSLEPHERTFTVKVTYGDLDGNTFEHSHRLDLGAYIHEEKTRQYTEEYRLHQIASRLKEIAKK